MPSSKPDSLFYKTLITDAFTSNIVLVGFWGLSVWTVLCSLVYYIGVDPLNSFAPHIILFPLGVVGGVLMVMGQKKEAINVYRTGREYQPEKLRETLGARPVSQREFANLSPILEKAAIQNPSARGFHNIYIVDMSAIGAFTIGSTIYLTSQTLTSPHLAPLVAHELGHIQNEDGIVMLALRLLFTNFWNKSTLDDPLEFSTGAIIGKAEDYDHLGKWVKASGVVKDLKTGLLILGARNAFAGGGFGVRTHIKEWSTYFQEQDYKADDFVVKCGYGASLVEFLEEYKPIYASNPLAWQPPPELRIDRILQVSHISQAAAYVVQQPPQPIQEPVQRYRRPEPTQLDEQIVTTQREGQADRTIVEPIQAQQTNEDVEDALSSFRSALEASDEDPDESVEDALNNFRIALETSDENLDESIEDALTNLRNLMDGGE